MTLSLNSRISSTPLLEAASISIISLFSEKCTQLSHLLQGTPSSPKFSQLIILEIIFAVEVFPVPRGPENK